MEANFKQQIGELIKGSQNILLVSHKNPDGDALGSLLALKIALEKMGKKATAVTSDTPNKIFDFLPRISEIKNEVEESNDFVISLDVSKTEIAKIGYKKDDEHKAVNIMITPRDDGRFEQSDVRFISAKPKFDLIISVDTPNIERLGEIANPTDLFFETPVINIDHHPSNEKFGKLNLVELVATSTAEILVSLFESLSKDIQLIDSDVATCLLAGLIYDTSSFQNINTTPKSLTVAAQLVAAGARQQEIVKNLYKTKSMETLKLWGLVLTKVREDKTNKFLWSSVSKGEISNTGADEGALSGVVDELLKSATDVDFAMLLSEREGYLHGSLRSIAKGVNVATIAEAFGGGGHEVAAAFRIEGDLSSKERIVLDKIIKIQEKNHGIFQDKTAIPEEKKDIVRVIKHDLEKYDKKESDDFAEIKEEVIEKAPLERFATQQSGSVHSDILKSEEVKAASSEIKDDAKRVIDSLKTELGTGENHLAKESSDDHGSQERVKTKW